MLEHSQILFIPKWKNKKTGEQSAGKIMRKNTFNRSLTIYLAYFIGALLGDGSLPEIKYRTGQYPIQFEVIDQDLVDNINECFEKIVGRRAYVYTKEPSKIGKRQTFFMRILNKAFYQYLEEITAYKKLIPEMIMGSENKEIVSNFIAGIMDTDGFITKAMDNRNLKNNRKWQMTMGINNTESWLFQLRWLLQRWGVMISGLKNEGIQGLGNKDRWRITINKESFIKSGFFFKNKRKQDRLNFYKEWLKNHSILRDYTLNAKGDDIVQLQK